MITLAETAGALMGRFRGEINAWFVEAVGRRPMVHGLTGSRDYDAELIPSIVYQAEAGLSFFHTHGEGMGVIVLAGGTIVASLVTRRALRGVLHALLAAAALFPMGFLASAAFTVAMGKDPGAEFAERWILIPAGSAAAAVFALLALGLAAQAMRRPRGSDRGAAG
jgi:hypothetical protein